MVESFEQTFDVGRHLDALSGIFVHVFRTSDLIGHFAGTHSPTFEQAHRCTVDCGNIDIFAFERILILLF